MSLAALLWKDALREGRGKETVQAGLVLVLLFGLVFLFAFPSLADAPRAAAAVIWLPMLFGGVAAAGRAMQNEADQGTLTLLRSSPVALGLHGLSRTLVNLVLVAALGVLALGMASLTWAISLPSELWTLVLLGAVGISVTATLTGALAAQADRRDALVPILAVPALAPLLQAGIQGSIAVLAGPSGAAATDAPVLLLAGYDAIVAGVAWFLWPIALEGD